MKPHKLQDIVVIDLECTCWNFKEEGQVQEVIEIGVCVLNAQTGEIRKPRSLLVKPQFGQVSEFCTRLTSLTQQDVEAGMHFSEAVRILQKEYLTRHRPLAAFGRDWRMLHRDCALHGLPSPLNASLINIASIARLRMQSQTEVGLKAACQHLNLEFEGQHHRGLDDAMMAAKILRELLVPARVEHRPAMSF